MREVDMSAKSLIAWLLCWMIFPYSSAMGRGDKVIPQVPDGTDFRTKIDLTNISPQKPMENLKVRFYRFDPVGAVTVPWTIKTNRGEGSEFSLSIGPRQTLRIETLGGSSPTTSGYAIIEDRESKNSEYSVDFVVGVSVFYEVYHRGAVVDTVSVPVGVPTALGTFPVEIDPTKQLYTGFAVVNLMGGPNQVWFDLFPQPSSAAGNSTFTLSSGEHRAEFLNQFLFPNINKANYKGMAEFRSQGPVAILALLQTQTSNGVQYATLAPTDKEALRRNSYVFLPQASLSASGATFVPLDVDAFVVDYFRNDDEDESYPWDLVYEGVNTTTRRLKPVNGAGLSILGNLNADAFDLVSLPELRGRTYDGTASIDLSDGSAGLNLDFAFAVRTELGNFAKVRIVRIVNTRDDKGDLYKDLALEVLLYR